MKRPQQEMGEEIRFRRVKSRNQLEIKIKKLDNLENIKIGFKKKFKVQSTLKKYGTSI